MGLDIENFGLGVFVGWATGYGVYRARHVIKRSVDGVRGSAQSAQKSATRSSDSRYVLDLVDYANAQHLGGTAVRLSDILVEPRFIPAERFSLPTDEVDLQNVFRVVPHVHAYPHLHSAFNIDTLSIKDLSKGSRKLALLGNQGTGRTTALLAIALHSLGKLTFTPTVDKVQEKIDREENALSEKERGVRVKERILIEQRARERLESERTDDFAQTPQDDDPSASIFTQLMPIYVHLSDIFTPSTLSSDDLDPAEPIVRTVQYRVRSITASTIPRNIYKRLSLGQVLLLIDGLDELTASQQEQAFAWLSALERVYPNNFLIVAGAVTGYSHLYQNGFVPVYTRPWMPHQTQENIQAWASQWGALNKRNKRRRGTEKVSEEAINRAKANTLALNPFELTTKIWAGYSEETDMTGIEGWMRLAISRFLPADISLNSVINKLAQLAYIELEEGFITSARMRQLAITGAEGDSEADKQEESSEATQDTSNKPSNEKEETDTTTSQGRLLTQLVRSGLLSKYRENRYQFRHSLFTAYLASLTLKTQTSQHIIELMQNPRWRYAIQYMAFHTPVDNIVRTQISAEPDLLYSNITEMARWVAYGPADTSWRGDILRELGNLITAPNLYQRIREYAAAALIETRHPESILVFRRAARNGNTDIRRLACLGLGALGQEEAERDLIALMKDQSLDVQISAAIALGGISTEPALEAMVIALTEGHEQVRQAVAETLATNKEEGYFVLHEASTDDDMMLRRAAIFGLRKINTTWALIAIYRIFLEDVQWYVRSAAQQAFQEIRYGREIPATQAYPSPEEIDWLISWAAQKGDTISNKEMAISSLVQVLQESDNDLRATAVENLGQLGILNAYRNIYSTLRDRNESVRSAAHRGLSNIQNQVGERLPLPQIV